MKNDEIIIILKRLYHSHIKVKLRYIIYSLLLSILVAGATSATAFLLDPAVKKIFIDKNTTYAWIIPICIIAAFSTKGLSLYFARIFIIEVGSRIGGELQVKIADNILLCDIKTLENKHSGKFISNLMFDAGAVTNLVSTGVLNIMKDSFTLAALVFVMFYQNWKLALFAILMMPLASLIAKSLGKRIGKAQGEASDKSGTMITFFSEIFKAAKMIRIYQTEKIERENAKKIVNESVEKNIKIAKIMIRATPIMEIFGSIVEFISESTVATGILAGALGALAARQAALAISSIVSAVANIFSGNAKFGPIGIITALAGVAAMTAAISKAKSVQLAEGGIVEPSPGGTLATIGEGGESEMVVPLSKAKSMGFGGGGGINRDDLISALRTIEKEKSNQNLIIREKDSNYADANPINNQGSSYEVKYETSFS